MGRVGRERGTHRETETRDRGGAGLTTAHSITLFSSLAPLHTQPKKKKCPSAKPLPTRLPHLLVSSPSSPPLTCLRRPGRGPWVFFLSEAPLILPYASASACTVLYRNHLRAFSSIPSTKDPVHLPLLPYRLISSTSIVRILYLSL